MSAIVFDKTGEHFFETGVKKCVLYPKNKTVSNALTYDKGVAWNGITSISENPSGAEATALYADDIKYLNLVSNEEFGASIEAYTYPDEFGECDGSASVTGIGLTITQQKRTQFGLCYRTTIGNDETMEKGYKLHIVYNCTAAPSEKSYQTINDSPEAITFSWEISTTPENIGTVNGVEYKPTAHLEIDSTKATAAGLAALEAALYGVDASTGVEAADPYLPTPAQVISLLQTVANG